MSRQQFDHAPPPIERWDGRLPKTEVRRRIDALKEDLDAAAERNPFAHLAGKKRTYYPPLMVPNETTDQVEDEAPATDEEGQ